MSYPSMGCLDYGFVGRVAFLENRTSCGPNKAGYRTSIRNGDVSDTVTREFLHAIAAEATTTIHQPGAEAEHQAGSPLSWIGLPIVR